MEAEKLSESAKKAIEDYINEAYVGLTDDQQASMFEIGDLKAETRDDIEFGYQLGYQEAMRELTRQAFDANSVKPVFDRAALAKIYPKGYKKTKM